MIATISPSIVAIEETLNTLKYANRAKNIKINIKKNVMESDYHISKYEEIISNLKNEIEDLKQQLAEKGKNRGKFLEMNMNGITKEEDVNSIEKIQKDITNHFQEEIKIREEIIDQERKIESIKSEVSENELNLYKNDNSKNEKKLKKVIVKLNASMDELTSHLDELYTKQSSLMKKRKLIQKTIAKYTKDKSPDGTMNWLYGKVLLNTYKYFISMIDSMTLEHRKFVNANELKRRDHQIEKLRDQIHLRDEFIFNAANELKSKKGNIKYSNQNLHSLEEIDMEPMRLPELVTGNFVKKKNKDRDSMEKGSGSNARVKTPSPDHHRMYKQELLPLLKNKNKNPSRKDSYLNRFKRIQNFRSENIRKDYKKRNRNFNNQIQGNNQGDEDEDAHNISHTSNLTGNEYKAVNRSYDSNISRLEMEMQQKVKTILRRDLIGRYKRSPYLKNMNSEFN